MDRPEMPSLARGATLARYVILDRLGAGGMGVVYKAYDPDLDRKVAIKLLNTGKTLSSDQEQRLLREARLMAKVNHVNVVTVYEAGRDQESSFVAMEVVEGVNLRQWLSQQPKSWRQILSMFIQAGRGLSAAHRAGVVHRDFKPGNVMVNQEGLAKVADFGVAAIMKEQILQQETAPQSPTLAVLQGDTQERAPVGSPDYMAPEQIEGKTADAKMDQYSFCVAMYEALHGQLPGRVSGFSRSPTLPARIGRILLRGMSRDPKDRYDSMDALLLELDRKPLALRWTIVWVVGLLALIAVGLWSAQIASQRDQLCRVAPEKWAGIWDDDQKRAVSSQFLSTQRPGAEYTARMVAKVLDNYVQSWNRQYTSSCQATQIRGEQSERMLDLRMRCLERRRQETSSLVHLFAGNLNAEMVDKAVEAAQNLSGLEVCADQEVLGAVVLPPQNPQERTQVEAIQKRLADAKALYETKMNREGLQMAEQLVQEARAVNYMPLLGESLLLLGRLQCRLEIDSNQADQTCVEAAQAAASGKDDRTLSEAIIERVWVKGILQNRFEEAKEQATTAGIILSRIENPKLILANLKNHLGGVLFLMGDLDQAQDQFQQAFLLRQQERGANDLSALKALINLANIHQRKGNWAQARINQERVLGKLQEILGPQHPDVAAAHNILASTLMDLGKFNEGLDHLKIALQINEDTLGPENPAVARTLVNFPLCLLPLGRSAEARTILERALTILNKLPTPPARTLTNARINLSRVLEEQGSYQAAIESVQKSLTVAKSGLPVNHLLIGEAMVQLGRLRYLAGTCHQAMPFLQQTLNTIKNSVGTSPQLMAMAMENLGLCQLALGSPKEAVQTISEGLALLQKINASSDKQGSVRFALAQALWPLDQKSKIRARELARQALTDYSHTDNAFLRQRGDIQRWIKTH